MIYNFENIIIEMEDEKISSYSITHDPFFLFIFSIYNIKHETINSSKIKFFCENIQPLSKYIKQHSKKDGHISYETVIKIIYDLGLIIKTLENSRKSILCFSIDDIVVINNQTFLFINTHKILDINNKNYITLKEPINLKTSFLSPDVNWKTLPIKSYYTSCYYSLADMIIFIIFGEKWNGEQKILNPIFKTRLYYFLLRCLENDSHDRKLFFL